VQAQPLRKLKHRAIRAHISRSTRLIWVRLGPGVFSLHELLLDVGFRWQSCLEVGFRGFRRRPYDPRRRRRRRSLRCRSCLPCSRPAPRLLFMLVDSIIFMQFRIFLIFHYFLYLGVSILFLFYFEFLNCLFMLVDSIILIRFVKPCVALPGPGGG